VSPVASEGYGVASYSIHGFLELPPGFVVEFRRTLFFFDHQLDDATEHPDQPISHTNTHSRNHPGSAVNALATVDIGHRT